LSSAISFRFYLYNGSKFFALFLSSVDEAHIDSLGTFEIYSST
jgi:hypothetical protein